MAKAAPLATARLSSIFGSIPAAVAVLRGPDHVFEYTNERYERLTGRRVLGLSVREALPELEGQGFLESLDRVYATGETFEGLERSVLLDRGGGELDEAFVTFVFTPTRDADGRVDGVFVHAVEVTELVRSRRRVEELARQLDEERARLESVLEELPAGVAIAEAPSGRLWRANRRWRETFGDRARPGDGEQPYAGFAAIHPDGRPLEPEEYPLSRAVAAGEAVEEEIEFVLGDGERRRLSFGAGPVRDREGRLLAGMAAFLDVTESRRVTALLETHQRILELVAAGAPLAETLDGLVRMIERRSEDGALASILLLGGRSLRHGAAASLAPAYIEAIDGLEIGEAAGSCGTAAHRGEPVVVEDIERDPLWRDYRHLALPHGLRACWSTPIRAHDGGVLGTFAVYYRRPAPPAPHDRELVEIATRTAAVAIERDRLERERAEALERERVARARAEARARAAVSLTYVDDGVCLLDPEGLVRLWNPAAERLLGVAEDEVVGRRPEEALPSWPALASQSVPGRPATAVPVEREGHERWLSVSCVEFEGGTVYAFRDVTDEHRLEELRAEMLATVSHELRTPLASVYGAAMTLQRAELAPEAVAGLVEMIGTQSERLRALVDRILVASRLEAGETVDLELERFDGRALAREIAGALGGGVAVELVLPAEPLPVAGDPERFRQVLSNLLDNARKYGGGGPVELRVEEAGDRVRFSVADRGPGIPVGERMRVFEKFVRLDPDMAGGVGGTGLGLYIARELVERMDGRLWVEQRPGGGAVFAFELPAAR